MHVGLRNVYQVETRGRVHLDRAGIGLLSNHLAMHLAFGRNIDHGVPKDLRLAAEPTARLQPTLLVVALLDAVPSRKGVVPHGHAVLGMEADSGRYLTFGADAASAANAVEIDPDLARGSQYRGACCDVPAAAGRREDDERVGHEQPFGNGAAQHSGAVALEKGRCALP